MKSDDSYIFLSGIQHIAFCERQWALIHVEQQWAENDRTVEGNHLHERVDDPFDSESRGDLYISRAVPIISHALRLQGISDVIEYWKNESEGIEIPEREGLWLPKPVEYKRGKPKSDDRDQVQLCAQAMCLEEMLNIKLIEGDLFYGETRRRQHVLLDNGLRERVIFLANRMNQLFERGITPLAVKASHCKRCSLEDLCLPSLSTRKRSVDEYLTLNLKEMGIK